MKKRLTLLIAVIISVFTLSGCKSDISYYYVPGETESAFSLRIYVDASEGNLLEISATVCSVNTAYFPETLNLPDRWTLDAYFDILINKLPDFNHIFTDYEHYDIGTGTIYEFSAIRENPPETETDESGDEGMVVEKGFFFYRVTVEQDNPFNDFIKEYNDKTNPSSPVSVFKNGLWNGNVQIFPAFEEAFPAFKSDYIYDRDLDLSYFLVTNNRLYSEKGFETDSFGNKYYLFSTSLNEENGTVKFEYLRANTTGWNILTLIIGALVVGGLLLYCHYAPKKKTASNDKNRNSNPFDGY